MLRHSDSERAGTVILIGMPRSGTTWLGKIFDSHPDTLYRHEPDSWEKLTDLPIVADPGNEERYGEAIRRFNEGVGAMTAPKVCAKVPIFRKSYLSSWRLIGYRLGADLARLAGACGVQAPVVCAPRKVPRNATLVWKSIESVGRLGLLMRSLDAHVIHLIRHPCGYVASVLRGEQQSRFEDNRGASEDYGLLEQLLDTYHARQMCLNSSNLRSLTPEERLAWRWTLFNDKAMREGHGDPRYAVLRYEDLCSNPCDAARHLIEFSGLAWRAETESFIQQSTSREDARYYGIFKDPVKAANSWRDTLTDHQQDRIRRVTAGSLPGAMFEDAL
jgi:hypothetical protein